VKRHSNGDEGNVSDQADDLDDEEIGIGERGQHITTTVTARHQAEVQVRII